MRLNTIFFKAIENSFVVGLYENYIFPIDINIRLRELTSNVKGNHIDKELNEYLHFFI